MRGGTPNVKIHNREQLESTYIGCLTPAGEDGEKANASEG